MQRSGRWLSKMFRNATPGAGCERMPDGTYSDYGFHSEMLEEDLSPDGRWTDANGNFSLARLEQ